jgi:hypothetical protein
MKSQWKNTILAYLLICLLSTTIIPTQAASTTWLDALINNVNIMLDGKIVSNKGSNYTLSNGSQVPNSILYKGTTYVPIRKLGELMGKDIGYIGETQTVVIGKMPAQQEAGWHLIDEEFTKVIPTEKTGKFLGTNDYWITITDYSSLEEGEVDMSTEYTTYSGDGTVGSVTRETYTYAWSTPPAFIANGEPFITTVSCNSSNGKGKIGASYFNDSLNPEGDGNYYMVESGYESTIKSPPFSSGYENNTRTVTITLSIGTDATKYTYTYEYRK